VSFFDPSANLWFIAAININIIINNIINIITIIIIQFETASLSVSGIPHTMFMGQN